MKLSASSPLHRAFFSLNLLLPVVLAAALAVTGCGSGGSTSSKGQTFSGNTNVTLVMSSTANDQLSLFDLDIQSFTLTGQSGNTVPVLGGDWPAEFIHVNGAIEPLATVSIPQGIYTAATAVIGGASFTCVTVMSTDSDSPGNLDQSTYAYGYTPNDQVTVNLPSSITITGDSMGLVLDLQVLQSASFPSTCYPPSEGIPQFSINPTFNLTAEEFSAQPTNPASGKVREFQGEVSALAADGTACTISLPNSGSSPREISVTSDSNTVFQGGISNLSGLTVGALVDMDGAIQPDGSLLATRVASYDPTALNVMIGPLSRQQSASDFYSFAVQELGQTYSTQPQSLGVYSYSGSTSYQISGQLSNVTSLPFVASFNSSNMVDGQNVAVYSQEITDYYGGDYTPATTMTLMPQIINATVVVSSQSGSFTHYTVSLAPYDLFPTLQSQPGQTTLLNNPNVVEVYVDSSTQMLNTQALAPGSTLRFYGLVFNDNGTLRMDCAQVNDGVAFTAPSNSANHMATGQARAVLHAEPGGQRVISTITQSHQN